MKKKQKLHVKPMEVYLGNLERFILKGLADTPTELSDCEVQVGYEILYSKSSQRCYYYIRVLPQYISANFYDAIRETMALKKTSQPVFVNFRIQGIPHVINWDSSEMRERRRQWANYERNKQEADMRFADNRTRQQSVFEEWRMKSWDYVQNAEDRKVQLVDCEITVEISTNGNTLEHKHSLLDVCKEFEQWCAKNGIRIQKVRNNIMDFLQYTSVTSLNSKTTSAKKVMNRVLSSEILADMTSYVPGKMNDSGVLFGIDLSTGMAVYKNMIRPGGDAENFLVIAETGGGKSFYMKALTMQMALNGFHQVVLDIDGEYQPAAKELDGIIINMSKAAGLYFDSTVIGDLTGDEAIDASLLKDSRTTTASIFGILCDTQNGMTHTETKLFNDAYVRLFEKYGISEVDPSTWTNSKQLSFHKLYQEIKNLANDPAYLKYEDALQAFIDKLYIYFEPNGLNAYLFQRPIDLADILKRKSKLPMFLDIVLNLESSGTGPVSVDTLIKQLTATYLVTLVTNYFKSMHEFSVHYIEEYQRYASSPGVESLVVYMITGNRKRNAATFVISNSPTALLKMSSASNQAIVDNITNYIIGKVKETTMDDVCKSFSLENCRSDLMHISKGGKYKNSFILKINNKDTTIVKQSMPRSLVKSPLFQTRDEKKKDE